MPSPLTIDAYAARFEDEPGYLDFARVGPVGRTVQEELAAQYGTLARGRFGSLDAVTLPDGRRIGYLVDARGQRVGRTVDGVLVAGYLYGVDGNPLTQQIGPVVVP